MRIELFFEKISSLQRWNWFVCKLPSPWAMSLIVKPSRLKTLAYAEPSMKPYMNMPSEQCI